MIDRRDKDVDRRLGVLAEAGRIVDRSLNILDVKIVLLDSLSVVSFFRSAVLDGPSRFLRVDYHRGPHLRLFLLALYRDAWLPCSGH